MTPSKRNFIAVAIIKVLSIKSKIDKTRQSLSHKDKEGNIVYSFI